MSRAAALLLVSLMLAAALAGLWLGEHAEPLSTATLCALFTSVVLATLLLRRLGAAVATVGAIGTAALFTLVWCAGAHEATLANNECITDGESVRESLARYHSHSGEFPQRLSDLGSHVPGQLTLPPGKLHYQRTGKGYVLDFGDWLVIHRACERAVPRGQVA